MDSSIQTVLIKIILAIGKCNLQIIRKMEIGLSCMLGMLYKGSMKTHFTGSPKKYIFSSIGMVGRKHGK